MSRVFQIEGKRNVRRLGTPPLIAASRRDVKAEHNTRCLAGTSETIAAATALPSENPSTETSRPPAFARNHWKAAIVSRSARVDVKIPVLRPYPE
jgi:hypothetical protein